jgi:hypothetical protein
MAAANPFQAILNAPDDPNPFAIEPIPNIPRLRADSEVGDLSNPSVTGLWQTITDLGTAIHNNRKSITKYRNVVQQGLELLQQEINNLADLINQIIELINRLGANPGNQARIQELQEQRAELLTILNVADTELRKLLNGRPGEPNIQLQGNPDIDPDALINNFNTLLTGLRDAQTRARHALDPANPAPGGPYQPIPALPPLAQPARGGKRKSKRHQKKSKKTNKKRSKKTAKKGKKMRGGYSYGKSKRRRGRNSPSSSVPSSLSSASKNVILF